MKTTTLLLLSAAAFLGATRAGAQPPVTINTADNSYLSVTVENGVLMGNTGQQRATITNDVTFPMSIVVRTNAQFKVGGGKVRKLTEGQTLTRDGQLSSPDGSIVPVEDHLTVKSGKILLVRDGTPQPLTAMFQLGDGTRVYPDGRMVTTRNVTRRLLDGQNIRLTDAAIESTDSARLEKGKVILFKDGGRIELRPDQVMSMSDGSRIDGRGGIVKPDGARDALREGELYRFAGAGDSR